MNSLELLELIEMGEGEQIEFKRDDLKANELAWDLAGLANRRCGWLLLGVEDDGTISGLQEDECIDGREATQPRRGPFGEWIDSIAFNSVTPPLRVTVETVEAHGKEVGLLRVSENPDKPYGVRTGGRLAYPIRDNRQTREASPGEVGRMYQSREHIPFELTAVRAAGPANDLDLERVENHFRVMRGKNLRHSDPEWQKVLVSTEILTETDQGIRPTVAGLLLFGKEPRTHLPQAYVQCVRFTAEEKGYDYLPKKEFSGPLVPMVSLEDPSRLDSPGLLDRIYEHLRLWLYEKGGLDGMRKVDGWLVPEVAVREVVCNALVHRDYSITGGLVRIHVYPDRVQVTSHGRLPNTVTVERVMQGVSFYRNQTLASFLSQYKYIDKFGMGIPLKVVHVMHQFNRSVPVLEAVGEEFRVTLLGKALPKQRRKSSDT